MPATVKYPKVRVTLVGEDGNAFSIIGRVSRAIEQGVGPIEAKKFRDKAMNSESYDALLQLCMRTVEVD